MCDIEGTPITLFCYVEQVTEDAEPTVLGSRLHQRGQVVGRDLNSLYVCYPTNHLVSMRPQLLRVFDGASVVTDASRRYPPRVNWSPPCGSC